MVIRKERIMMYELGFDHNNEDKGRRGILSVLPRRQYHRRYHQCSTCDGVFRCPMIAFSYHRSITFVNLVSCKYVLNIQKVFVEWIRNDFTFSCANFIIWISKIIWILFICTCICSMNSILSSLYPFFPSISSSISIYINDSWMYI